MEQLGVKARGASMRGVHRIGCAYHVMCKFVEEKISTIATIEVPPSVGVSLLGRRNIGQLLGEESAARTETTSEG